MTTNRGMSVRVENLSRTIRSLEKFGVEASDLKEAFGDIATRVQKSAKDEAPRRTGSLEAGIKASRRKNAALIWSNRPARQSRPYHRFVYFGARGRRPNKYLARAVARNIGWVDDRLVEGLNEAIRRAGL